MNVLICGGRFFQDRKPIFDWIEQNLGSADTVIHGDCHKGADKIADDACEVFQIPTIKFPADWSLGRGAGMKRNQQMIDLKPDRVVAFWDGLSPGTRNTLSLAIKAGIPYIVIAQRGCSDYVAAGLQKLLPKQGSLLA